MLTSIFLVKPHVPANNDSGGGKGKDNQVDASEKATEQEKSMADQMVEEFGVPEAIEK